MSRLEMLRRLREMTEASRLIVYRYFRAGNGSGNARHECPGSVKQQNAVAEWADRYGMILPTDAMIG